jgi:hypothetical protein
MMQIPAIRDQFKAQFELFYQFILPDFLTLIDVLGQSLAEAASRNFERWPILSIYIWPNPWQMLRVQPIKNRSITSEDMLLIVYLGCQKRWIHHAMRQGHLVIKKATHRYSVADHLKV